jgi:hypothetical protein
MGTDMARGFDDIDGAELTAELGAGETIRIQGYTAAFTSSMVRYFTPAAARELAAHLVELADEADTRAL